MIKIRENLYQGGLDDLDIINLGVKKFDYIENVAKELGDVLPTNIDYFSWMVVINNHGLVDDYIEQNDEITYIIDNIHALISLKNKVLVICSAGLSRSPYVIARYLSKYEGRTIESVYKELKLLNPAIDDRSPLRANDSLCERFINIEGDI